MNMRYLADRPNRLKIQIPKGADSVEHDAIRGIVTAKGKRYLWVLHTEPAMNALGDVYLTARWIKMLNLDPQPKDRS